jgi:pimeloyl-ACP methyl ester carboxylesterase
MENLLNHPLISERYFFPRSGRLEQPFWVECGGVRLGCHFHEVAPTAKTIVHFHGNGEIVDDYLDGFPELIEQFGVNCFLAEFRGYGASSGRPELGRMLEDVCTIIEAIGYPQNRLVLFGRSVGSLFAIKALESFPHIAGLILESAIADPLERLLLRIAPEEIGVTLDGLVTALEQQLDIRRIMQSYLGPTLIMHTRHDGLVDVAHAESLASWAGGNAELVVFPHGNHNDIMFVNGPEYFGRVRDFLAAL